VPPVEPVEAVEAVEVVEAGGLTAKHFAWVSQPEVSPSPHLRHLSPHLKTKVTFFFLYSESSLIFVQLSAPQPS